MNLVEYMLRKRFLGLVVSVVILCWGLLAYKGLGRYEDPEYLIRGAEVITLYPGARPTEVEKEVTELIEEAVQELEEIEDVNSVSRAGISRVTIMIDREFAPTKKDLQQVWDKLRRKIADAQRRLPPGAGPSIVNDDWGDVYALFLAVTGDGYTYTEMREYVDMLSRELLLLPGVAKVVTMGDRQDAIFVEIPRAKLAQLGISPENIFGTLQQQNVNAPAGKVTIGQEYIEISPTGAIDSIDDIGDLLISGRNVNRQIFLHDVATIYRGYIDPPRGIVRYNGQLAIAIGVSNVSGGNVVTMGDAVTARLKQLESLRPIGMELEVISYQPDTVRKAIRSFIRNLVLAVFIVTGMLLVFMGLRCGVIMGSMLVLTVAATFIAMSLDGISMQRISLGALIISLGMLVDNGIVVTEGILIRMQRGEDAISAASKTVRQTMWPLLGGTLVGLLAFSPIGFSSDTSGEYAGSLFWVVTYSLLLSWVLAITLTPLYCILYLKVPDPGEAAKDPYNHALYRVYRRVLERCLQNRTLTIMAMLLLLGGSIMAFAYVPPGFMPDSPRPQFVVDYWRPYGTDIRETSQDLKEIEQRLLEREGVTKVSTFVGHGALRFMLIYYPKSGSPGYGQILIDVDDVGRIPELMKEVRSELIEAYPDAQVNVWKHVLGFSSGSKIIVSFRGSDAGILRDLSEQAQTIMYDTGMAIGIKDNWRERVKVIRPVYSQKQASRAGISLDTLRRTLHTSFTGATVGVYREEDQLIPIVFRLPEHERSEVDAIADVQVWSPTASKAISINQIVTGFDVEWEDPIIRRENRFPIIRAMCDPAPGRRAADLHAQIESSIEAIELPPGYVMEWEGEFGDARDARSGLNATLPFGFAAMLLTVVFLFNAFRQPLIIWLVTPLAIIGVTAGLLIFQVPFEFMATLGFLSLIGMLVKNGIVLVDRIDQEIRDGKDRYEAILDSCVSRIRPVSMGSFTTVLGVAPLLTDPFFKSMAVTIMFGLSFATVLTLIVVPVLYSIFFRIRSVPASG